MPTDLELQVERSSRLRSGSSYEKAIDRYAAARKARTEAEERRRLEEAQARHEAAMQGQKLSAEARSQSQDRDASIQASAQRAAVAADAAAMDNRYTTQRDQLQQKGIQKRDQLQAGYDKESERRKALDQQIRDTRMFEFNTAENDQKFGQQIRRDELQHGFSTERDQQQHYNTLDRDASQFGYSTLENRQQQRDTLERDAFQHQNQLQRDELQNDYSLQAEELQYGNQFERDKYQQQYEQQNMYQREAADIRATWQQQVQQAQKAGLDFSPRQQQQMKELDAAFRKHVLNNPTLPEGLKQQAMVQYQQKMAAFVPEDKVVTPEQEIGQQFYEHPSLGLMNRTLDSKGNPVWQPIGAGGGQQPDPAKIQAEQQKEAERINKLTLDRHLKFNETLREVRDEIDPTTLKKIYATPEAIDAEVMKRFAPQEEYYTRSNLPPHEMYQLQARKDQEKQQKELQKQQRAEQKRQQTSQYDVQRNTAITPPVNPYKQKLESLQKPTTQSTTVPVSSVNIDDTLKQAMDAGDQESASALQAIKEIVTKFNGPPPEGSPEFDALMRARIFLKQKGRDLSRKPEKAKESNTFSDAIRAGSYGQ